MYGQTASFPTSVPTSSDLLLGANDRAETTLSSGIDSSTLTINVASGALFAADMLVTIENERIKVCSVAGNVLTVCSGGRGFAGSVAASHTSGRTVSGRISSWYHKRLGVEVAALANSIGASMANVLPRQTGHLTYNPSDGLGRKIFGIGATSPNYPLHFEYGTAPSYGSYDTGAMFGRKHTSNLSGSGSSQSVMTIQHDAYYATGTPWSLAVFFNSQVQNSAGTTAILARTTKEAASTDISMGFHGECFNYAEHGTCIAFNAEAINIGSLTSDVFLVGFNANVGTGGLHIGGANAITGFRATMNHTGTNAGSAFIGHASVGTHAYGLRLQDDASSVFTIPLSIYSKKSGGSIFEMVNEASGTNPAPNQIKFGRSPSAFQGMIESDIAGAGSFGEGYVDLYTRGGNSLLKAVRWDNNGNQFMQRGYFAQAITTMAVAAALDPGQWGAIKLTPGDATVTSIAGCNAAAAGRELTLVLEAAITINDSATFDAPGGSNLAVTAEDVVGLFCNGAKWKTRFVSAN
jgi:hypothetical protein